MDFDFSLPESSEGQASITDCLDGDSSLFRQALEFGDVVRQAESARGVYPLASGQVERPAAGEHDLLSIHGELDLAINSMFMHEKQCFHGSLLLAASGHILLRVHDIARS